MTDDRERTECKVVRTVATDETGENAIKSPTRGNVQLFLVSPHKRSDHIADPDRSPPALSMLLGVLEHGRSSTGSTANPAYIACPAHAKPVAVAAAAAAMSCVRVCE